MKKKTTIPRRFWREFMTEIKRGIADGVTDHATQLESAIDHCESEIPGKLVFQQMGRHLLNVTRGKLIASGEYAISANKEIKRISDFDESDVVACTTRRDRESLGALLGYAKWLRISNQEDECKRILDLVNEIWPAEVTEEAVTVELP